MRWRRVFPGQERQLGVVRRWLSSLLPAGPARDDLLTVASELASNSIRHTASGRGGHFAVDITMYDLVVRVAVADAGGPRYADDRRPDARCLTSEYPPATWPVLPRV